MYEIKFMAGDYGGFPLAIVPHPVNEICVVCEQVCTSQGGDGGVRHGGVRHLASVNKLMKSYHTQFRFCCPSS